MSTKRIVARNALWNWTGMAAHMLVGFFIAPFLVHRLGDSTYGLWIVIGSLTSYFGVLDFGVAGSVGRNIALFRARHDLAGINAILSTALVYLSTVAGISLLATLGAMVLFFNIIPVEPDQVEATRLALLSVGLTFALTLPLEALDGILWAYERFDLQNGIDIPIVLLRAGLTVYFIGNGYGLVALGVITLTTSVAGLAIKSLLALRLEAGLRVSVALVSRESARGLFGYGVWFFLLSLARTVGPQVSLAIVGNRLGTALVTPFTVATRLTGYANQFLIAGTQVLTPLATALHARDDQERQRSLFVRGGRGCLALTLLFVSLFVLLGRPLIRLWMGSALELSSYSLLVVLAAGELLPMSQWITYSMILGQGRHRILAISTLVEIAVSAAGALLLAPWHGLTGVCWAIAVPAALCRGVCPLVYACRTVGVPVVVYVCRSFGWACLIAAGPALLLGLTTRWWQLDSWPELFLCGGAYAVIYLAVAGTALFGVQAWFDLGRRAQSAWAGLLRAFCGRSAPARTIAPCPADSAQQPQV